MQLLKVILKNFLGLRRHFAWHLLLRFVCCDIIFFSLQIGNELPIELLQSLLKMAPSADEELKIRLYNDDISLLGPAEQFIKMLVNIPYVFQRLDVLLFMSLLPEEAAILKESFSTLQVSPFHVFSVCDCINFNSSSIYRRVSILQYV